GTELLALSSKGRLITCSLDLNSEVPVPPKMTMANAGQKIKELLLDIGDASERVSFLKKAVDQRNKAITSLNEAMNVSCALLSSQEGVRPISCTITTSWSRLELRDMLMATCTLENSSSFSLDQGWTLCIQVSVTDLSPAGPIQAVEIQVESSSLANMCRAHHAIIRRMQTMVTEQAAQGSSPPDLRMQYLHQIHANHQELLREVQTLRDQLCTEDEVRSYSTAQKLLQVYKQLRNPSLVLL
ncbi:Fanconi anemia-associated protein, partial [Cricetulus griseus]